MESTSQPPAAPFVAQPFEIVWKDPPPPKPRHSQWAERLAPLRERPGQWALIKTDTPERVSGLRGRLMQRVGLKDVFEFRAHRISTTEAELYARARLPPAATS